MLIPCTSFFNFYHVSIFVPADEREGLPWRHTAHGVLWANVDLSVVDGFRPLWSSCVNKAGINVTTFNTTFKCMRRTSATWRHYCRPIQSVTVHLHSTYSQALCQSFPLVLMASHSYPPTSSYCTLYRWSTAPDSLISWFGGRSVASTFLQTIWGMGLKRHMKWDLNWLNSEHNNNYLHINQCLHESTYLMSPCTSLIR